jgi:hypothetical protein
MYLFFEFSVNVSDVIKLKRGTDDDKKLSILKECYIKICHYHKLRNQECLKCAPVFPTAQFFLFTNSSYQTIVNKFITDVVNMKRTETFL